MKKSKKTTNLKVEKKLKAKNNVPKGAIKPKRVKTKPQITEMLNIPLGELKPGSQVKLKGKYFGSKPGKIFISGDYFCAPMALTKVK